MRGPTADVALLREFIGMSIDDRRRPTSRMRRLPPTGLTRRLPQPLAGLLFPESYVRGVLGVDRSRLLAEGLSAGLVSEVVVNEHLLFEGWWDSAKQAVAGIVKNNPITSAAEAAQELGKNIKGVTVALTQAVTVGGSKSIDQIASASGSLLGELLGKIREDVNSIAKRLTELADKVSNLKIKKWIEGVGGSVASLVDRIVNKIKRLAGGDGWKAMLAKLVAYLAVSAVAEKINPMTNMTLEALSGDPKKMIAVAGKITAGLGDEGRDEEDDDPPPADGDEGLLVDGINKLTDAFRGFAMGLVIKAFGAAGSVALEQLAGPVGWLKQVGDVFEKVAGGISWVCEKILVVMDRVSWPAGGERGSAST